MHKLMKTNRSTVVILKNMVTIEECDDELEVEIREECTKYGKVEEVNLQFRFLHRLKDSNSAYM